MTSPFTRTETPLSYVSASQRRIPVAKQRNKTLALTARAGCDQAFRPVLSRRARRSAPHSVNRLKY
jgi:hypothetical protein